MVEPELHLVYLEPLLAQGGGLYAQLDLMHLLMAYTLLY